MEEEIRIGGRVKLHPTVLANIVELCGILEHRLEVRLSDVMNRLVMRFQIVAIKSCLYNTKNIKDNDLKYHQNGFLYYYNYEN